MARRRARPQFPLRNAVLVLLVAAGVLSVLLTVSGMRSLAERQDEHRAPAPPPFAAASAAAPLAAGSRFAASRRISAELMRRGHWVALRPFQRRHGEPYSGQRVRYKQRCERDIGATFQWSPRQAYSAAQIRSLMQALGVRRLVVAGDSLMFQYFQSLRLMFCPAAARSTISQATTGLHMAQPTAGTDAWTGPEEDEHCRAAPDFEMIHCRVNFYFSPADVSDPESALAVSPTLEACLEGADMVWLGASHWWAAGNLHTALYSGPEHSPTLAHKRDIELAADVLFTRAMRATAAFVAERVPRALWFPASPHSHNAYAPGTDINHAPARNAQLSLVLEAADQEFLDVWPLLEAATPRGKIGRRGMRKGVDDALHWCQPGVPDDVVIVAMTYLHRAARDAGGEGEGQGQEQEEPPEGCRLSAARAAHITQAMLFDLRPDADGRLARWRTASVPDRLPAHIRRVVLVGAQAERLLPPNSNTLMGVPVVAAASAGPGDLAVVELGACRPAAVANSERALYIPAAGPGPVARDAVQEHQEFIDTLPLRHARRPVLGELEFVLAYAAASCSGFELTLESLTEQRPWPDAETGLVRDFLQPGRRWSGELAGGEWQWTPAAAAAAGSERCAEPTHRVELQPAVEPPADPERLLFVYGNSVVAELHRALPAAPAFTPELLSVVPAGDVDGSDPMRMTVLHPELVARVTASDVVLMSLPVGCALLPAGSAAQRPVCQLWARSARQVAALANFVGARLLWLPPRENPGVQRWAWAMRDIAADFGQEVVEWGAVVDAAPKPWLVRGAAHLLDNPVWCDVRVGLGLVGVVGSYLAG